MLPFRQEADANIFLRNQEEGRRKLAWKLQIEAGVEAGEAALVSFHSGESTC